MNINTPVTIERLKTLYSIVAGIPLYAFDLNSWRLMKDKNGHQSAEVSKRQLIADAKKHTCGTHACIAGWAAAVPEFAKAGLAYRMDSWNNWTMHDRDSGSDGYEAAMDFFGVDGDVIIDETEDSADYVEFAAQNLFEMAARWEEDRYGTHRAIALARIRHYLFAINAITAERSDELEREEETQRKLEQTDSQCVDCGR